MLLPNRRACLQVLYSNLVNQELHSKNQVQFTIQRSGCRPTMQHIYIFEQVQYIFVMIEKDPFARSCHFNAKKVF